MRGIKIINPGMLSTIQDGGRTGYREFGLPKSGVMDLNSYYIANWLVKNSIDEAVIETIFTGLEIEFLSSVNFAVTGGDMSPELDGKKITNWKSYRAKSGNRLVLKRMVSGARSYIGFSGGFRIDSQLGSMSTYVPGNIGGYRGRSLRSGDVIPLYPGIPFITGRKTLSDDLIPEFRDETLLRVTRGVDFNSFDSSMQGLFQNTEYVVTSQSDRMGLRLDGQQIHSKNEKEIISYGIQPGTIQVPGNGKPIVMGADCQTIGGYPQIANIISVDIPLVGQLSPGNIVRFSLIEHGEALELLKLFQGKINKLFGGSGASVCTDCIDKRR